MGRAGNEQNGIIVSIIALAAAIILSYFLAKTITGPIKQLIAKTKAVAGGDLTVQTAAASKDEIGILTKDFNKMIEHMKEMIVQVRSSSGKVSIGYYRSIKRCFRRDGFCER